MARRLWKVENTMISKAEELSRINGFKVQSVFSDAFKTYGRVLKGFDVSEILAYMQEHTGIPAQGNIYVASVQEMEMLPIAGQIQRVVFGDLPTEAGYCNGRNSTFNGFEYHKSPEINIAVSDFALALGHSWDIGPELSYSMDSAEVFFVEKGTVIEMFGTTLHLSPLRVSDDGFRDIVILPRGVNTPLTEEDRAARDAAIERGETEARLLLQRGKWVISHPEREPLIKQGAWPGVTGENRELKY